ncbi:MAG: DUF3857 domain-containing protein [Phycisphaerae bacterium]
MLPNRQQFLQRLIAAIVSAALIVSSNAQTSRPIEPLDQPDAIVNFWRQHWTKSADGSIVYHERKEVTINTDRAHRDFADPRITYDSATQTVEIIAARTRLPSGKTIDVPAYSRTEVAPGWASGWPAYATIRQMVLVMSGIERGCVVELEYKLITKPAAKAVLAGELRLQDRYPIKRREIRFDLAAGEWLRPWLSGISEQAASYAFDQRSDGSTAHTMVIPELPVLIEEPASPPWQTRAARVTFSASGKADAWLSEQLHAMFDLSDPGDDLTKVAQSWVINKSGTREETIRAIQERVAATFNVVDVDAAYRSWKRRTADEVLRGNFGTPADAAVMMLALARAAGLKAQPAMLLRDGIWVEKTPQEGLIGAFAIAVPGDAGLEFWHPQHGRMQRSGRWSGCTLATAEGEDGALQQIAWPAWTNVADSRVAVTGELAITADATLTGRMNVRLSGCFVNAEELRKGDAQQARVRDILKRVSSAIDVESVTIRALAPDTFEATAQIKSAKPIEGAGDLRRLAIGADGIASGDVELPLASAKRQTTVLLPAALEQQVDITLSWSAEWTIEASPSEEFAVTGEWGSATSDVDLNAAERKLRLTREIRFPSREFSPALWLAASEPLNDLRKEASRTVLLRKAGEKR